MLNSKFSTPVTQNEHSFKVQCLMKKRFICQVIKLKVKEELGKTQYKNDLFTE